MIETQTWFRPTCVADDPVTTPRHSETRGRRWCPRLWTILNAQALIHGRTGGPDDVAFVEDDRPRLARRGS
jgi:hypothetical protein